MKINVKNILNKVLRVNEIKGHCDTLFKKNQYFITKKFLQSKIFESTEYGLAHEQYTSCDVIVSLTTYGRRIYDVPYTIESIFQQTMKANKVILWLDEGFKNKKIPRMLSKLENRGLLIEYCKDIKSYKKLIPTLNKYPHSIIITVDDDVLYPVDFIENLLVPYLNNPEEKIIYCNRCHEITLDKKGKINAYKDWNKEIISSEASFKYVPTGVGGVLYPPNCFYEDICNEELFMSLAPKADDLWFKAMTLLNGYRVKRGLYRSIEKGRYDYIDNIDVQDMALGHYNVNDCGNDVQMANIIRYYNITDLLNNE